jgi:hypothetical protein
MCIVTGEGTTLLVDLPPSRWPRGSVVVIESRGVLHAHLMGFAVRLPIATQSSRPGTSSIRRAQARSGEHERAATRRRQSPEAPPDTDQEEAASGIGTTPDGGQAQSWRIMSQHGP